MAMQLCCCVCWDVYDPQAPARQPRTLPCGHTACTGCLRLVSQSPLQSRSCPTCRYPMPGDQTTCFPRNFALEDAIAHLNEQQCKARAAIKDAQQESCQMAGALKDSMTKVATGKAIKLELEQLYNQALKREADLKKHWTEAKGQAEAAEKKLALAEAKVRNKVSLRQLQMRHSQVKLSKFPGSQGIAGQLRQLAEKPAQSSIGSGQQGNTSGAHASFPDLQQQLSIAETRWQKHHAAACQHEYSSTQNQTSMSHIADSSSALLPSTSHSSFEPPLHSPLLRVKTMSGHKDLTSKDSSLLRKARHSKAGQPQEGIHFKVLLTMRQTFHYLQVLIKGMAQNWLLERQRTAEDLSGKDYSGEV